MDLVEIIDAAIEKVPDGDHTLGLLSVKRHISVAMRHYANGDGGEIDSFTDAIYRTNQAFEGSLKEAYRVLAEKSPDRKSPFEIETYLEQNNLIRPRVLKQLTRYREDYRNPSTHDYKLDFDADEALLAITSVCAFVKLLINQISAKLAFKAGSNQPSRRSSKKINNLQSLAEITAAIIVSALETNDTRLSDESDLDSYIEGALSSSEIEAEAFPETESGDLPTWDIISRHGDFEVPVETRNLPNASMEISFDYIRRTMEKERVEIVVTVLVDPVDKDRKFSSKEIKFGNNKRMIVVIPDNIGDILDPADRRVLESYGII